MAADSALSSRFGLDNLQGCLPASAMLSFVVLPFEIGCNVPPESKTVIHKVLTSFLVYPAPYVSPNTLRNDMSVVFFDN